MMDETETCVDVGFDGFVWFEVQKVWPQGNIFVYY